MVKAAASRLLKTILFGSIAVLDCAAARADYCPREPSGRADEARVLKRLKQGAARSGDLLTLATGAGPALFRDTDCVDGAARDCIKYALTAVFPTLDLWVLELSFYEGGSYLLIDRKTGQKTEIGGFPWLSPNLKRFATVINDSHSDTYEIAVWTMGKAGLEHRWNFD